MQNNDALTKYLSNRRIENATRLQDFALKRQQKEIEEQQRKIEAEEQARIQREAEEQSKRDNAGFWEKAGATIADVFTELGGGLLKLIEGVADISLTANNIPIIGVGWWIEKISGKDDLFEDIIKFDATQEWWYSWEDKLTEKSYMNDAPIVKDIVRGIGQQLPTIAMVALAPFTGGATLAAVPALQIGQAASAGGQGVEEALNDGASGGQATAYGLMQGGMEYLLEKIPLGTGKIASSVIKDGTQSAAKSIGKNIGRSVLEEALQETVQEGFTAAVNPLTKTIYKGSEALQQYKNPEFWKDVGYQAVVGGITGGLTGGASTALHTKAAIKEAGGKSNYNVQQSAQEINTLNTKEDNLWKNGKLTTEQESKIEAARQVELNNISKQLKGMDADNRTEAIKKYNLSNQFTAEGDIVASSTQDTLVEGNSATVSNVARKPLISDNKEAYSPSLRNTELKLAPTSSALSESSIAAKKMITTLDPKARIVVTDNITSKGGKTANAFYDKDSGAIYINNEANTSDVMKAVAVHEVTHTLEGTKQYGKLLAYTKAVMGESFETEIVKIRELYKSENAEAKADHIIGENVAIDEAEREVVADFMGNLLSDEASIKRIVNRNKGLAWRIFQWVKDSVVKITNKDRNAYSWLRAAEKFYADAIKASVGGVSPSEVFEYYKKLAELEESQNDSEGTDEISIATQYSLQDSIKTLDGYSELERRSILANKTNLIAETYEDIVDFIENAKPNSASKNLHIGKIKSDLAEKIKAGTGLETTGHSIVLNSNDVYHIFKKHGAETTEVTRGQKPVTKENILDVIDTMLTPETVRSETDNKSGVTSLIFEKTIDGKYTAVSILSNKKTRLTLKSAWISQSRGRTTVGAMTQKASKSTTSETLRSIASTNSINETTENVNPDNKKSGERYAIDTSNQQDKASEKQSTTKDVIRYSLVADNKDLVAIHNLTEEKLLGILELGGFPMPSIAVTKPKILHDNFGEISVVFDKSAIDPKQAGNATFPGDAYSPRFPSIGYKISEKARLAAYKKITALLNGVQLPERMEGASSIFYEDNILSDLDRRGGFAKANAKNRTLQLAFLKDKEIDFEMPLKKEMLGDFPASFWEELSAKIPMDFQDNSYNSEMQYEPVIRELYKKYYSKMDSAEAANALFDKPLQWSSFGFDVSGTFDNLKKFRKGGKRNIVDEKALYAVLDEKVDSEDFIKWLNEVSADFVEKKGLRNNADPFTASGNRRSFEALHYEYTLQNIIKIMKSEGLNGAEKMFGTSPSGIAASLMRPFKSIDEMKNLSEKLNTLPEEEIQKIKDKQYEMLSEITTELAGQDASFDAIDGAAETIGEIASKKLFTTERILAYLDKEYKGIYNYDETLANKILDLFAALKESPIEYFEAKPMRVISFEEVKAVIVPSDVSSDLKTALDESNLPVYEYSKEESRTEIIAKLDNVRFSLKTDSDGRELTEAQAEFFKDSKVVDKDGNLLVVYHGTGSPYFTVFDKKKIGENYIQSEGGFFFTDKLQSAENYAELHSWAHKDGGARVVSVYLKIEKPYIVSVPSSLNGIGFFDDHRGEILSEAEFQNADGIIAESENGSLYIAFEPNQIKLVTNLNPTANPDIRFSLKNGEGSYQYSKGQIARYIAEHSKAKAYSRTDAEQIVNTLVSNQLSFGNKYGEISGKTQKQVVDMLWHVLNTKDEGYRGSAALDIAEFIIDNAVMEDIYADEVNEADIYILNTLRQYLHGIDLSGIKGEIAHRYDKDNSHYLLWGKRKGTRASAPDQIAMELEESGIRLNATNEADIFFEIDGLYRSALRSMKKAAKDKLADIASKDDLVALKQEIAREILLSYDTAGHQTKFDKTIEKYTNKISALKAAIRDIKAGNKAKNNVVSTIERMRDEFVKHKPAGWEIPQQVADFVKKIAKVETWRNNISKTARETLRELSAQIDAVLDDTQKAIYPFKDTIDALGGGKGELSTEELMQLDEVLRSFIHQLRNYDKVIFGGKEQSIEKTAENAVNESKQAKTILKYGGNVLIRFKNYVYENPYDRLAEMGLYRRGSVAMRMYADMLEGDRRRAKFAYDTNNLFEAFFKANKKYINELHGNVTIGSGASAITLTKGQMLSIYSTSLREQGRGHLFNESDDTGIIRLLDDTLAKKGKMKEAFAKGRDVKITSEMIAEIKDNLSSVDNEFLELTNKFFNEMSRDAKRTTDEQIYGITNLEEGHYFPIHVSSDKIYSEAGQNNANVNQFILSMGMNKATVPNAKNKIVIDDIFSILLNHERDMSLYYGFAVPLVAYNRIMNKQVEVKDGNLDTAVNMRSELNKIDPYFEGYMDRLWQDVQGITSREKSMLTKAMDYLRWAGANSALGLNPKVLVTQMLSLASATAEFNPKYVTKGMGHFFGKKQKIELSRYSPLMWERMQIGNSVEIEDVRKINSKFGKIGSFIGNITKPITFMDGNVISSLWFAAQYEIADTMGNGYELGTEENKIEAGKRLDEVVFRTQQTADKLGRSEYMRSQNEIVKFMRMFTGDIVQLVGRMIASVNKVRIAHKMIKSSDSGLSKQGSAMLGEARKGVAKAGGAFLLNQVMLLAIAMAFKWIKGKKDDEDWGEVAQKEALANLFGLIPLGGDIFDKLQGYEPTNMAYTALSNTVDIVADLYGGIATLVSGDYVNETELRGKLRKSALAISKLTGIPLQNLESYLMGVVGKASPATKEEYDALFKTKSNKAYLDKLSKALENDDEALADTIVNLMFDSKTGRIKDDKVMETIRDLLELGYDVLPKSLSDEITYNGEKINLTSRQHAAFKKIYSEANDKVKTMVNSSMFARLEDGAKAKAFKTVYDFYFNLGLEDLLGEDLENKNILFSTAIPIEQLAMAVAQSQHYEADLDKKGNTVSGSKKIKVQNFVKSLNLTAVQKYIVMGYLGYTNANGAAPVKAYINGLKLSRTQKETLYELSGYKLEKKRAG